MKGAIASGELPADADARALALYVSTILQGLSAQARDGATRADLEAIVDTAMRAWPRSRRRRADTLGLRDESRRFYSSHSRHSRS
jgi:hypothetical protein